MIMEGRSWHKVAQEKGARVVSVMRAGYSYLHQLYTTCFVEFDTLEDALSFRKFADENLPYWDYDPVATIDGTKEEVRKLWRAFFLSDMIWTKVTDAPPPAGEEHKAQDQKIRNGAIYSGEDFGRWIPVDEALPPIGYWVYIALQLKHPKDDVWKYDVDAATMTYDGYGYIDRRWDTIIDWDEGEEIHVTHWMPFPKQPIHPYEMPAPAEDEL